MKALLVSKPLMGLAALLLIVQLACVASSISPTATPGAAGGSSSTSTQAVSTQPSGGSQATQPSSGSQSTQPVPLTGGQTTQAAPPNAQAMLNAVAQHYQAAGRQQALKDFTDRNAPFDAPGSFVMCLGSDHTITAMGGFPLLVGVSADSLNILNGQSLGNLIWDAASLAPQGQVPFQWKNPLTSQSESKTLFYQKLSQDVCGVVASQP